MKYFTFEEFQKSYVAKQKCISNQIPPECKENIARLVERVLDPVREYMKKACRITSGYRCEEVNEIVHGSPNSQHMKGEAADFTFGTLKDNVTAALYISDYCDFDQLILYKTFIHVSYTSSVNRHQIFVKTCLNEEKITSD